MNEIVVLERESVDPLIIRFAVRAQVPAARQAFFADPEATSEYAPTNANPTDLALLRSGAWIEEVHSRNFSGLTRAQWRKEMIDDQATLQAALNADGVRNRWKFYGTTYDLASTTWTDGGVN